MANDHKTCMSEVVTNFLSVKNSKVMSETKYDQIVEHLQRPNGGVLVIPKRATYVTVG